MSGIRSRLHKKHEVVRLMHKHGYHPSLTASEKHLTYVLSEFLKSKNHKYINFKYGNNSSDLINGEYVFDKYYDEFNDWLKVFKPKHDIYVDKLYKTTWSKKHYNHLNKLERTRMKKLTQAVFSLPECPPWAKSATVDIDGTACYFAHTKEYLCVLQVSKIWGYREKLFGANCKEFGTGYWQQSAINREGWEL